MGNNTLPDKLKKYYLYDFEGPEDSYEIINHKALKEAKKPLFGLENEIAELRRCASPYKNRSWDNLRKEIRERMGVLVALHSDSGVEVDSPPLEYSSVEEYYNLLLGKPLKYALKTQPDDSGMHVHIGIKAFNKISLQRMLTVILDSNNSKIMSTIAERDTTSTGHYGYLDPIEEYVKPKYVPYFTRAKKSNWWRNPSVRHGVYLNSEHDTHEFRFFKSTVDPVKAIANVEIVQSWATFFKSNKGDMKSWLSFVTKKKTTYSHAHFWMRKKGLM